MCEAIGRRRGGTARLLSAAVLLSCAVLPAAAQQPTQAQQNAIRQSCRADYQAQCASVPSGGMAALQCLQQHVASLSSPCATAVSAVGAPAAVTPPAQSAPAMPPREEMAMMRRACGADYRRVCPGVRPGGGQAMQCLKANFQSLSAGCRRVLSHVAASR